MIEITIDQLSRVVDALHQQSQRVDFWSKSSWIYPLPRSSAVKILPIEMPEMPSSQIQEKINLRFDIVGAGLVECKQLNLKIKI